MFNFGYHLQRFMQDFRLRGVHRMFGGPSFEGLNEILQLGKAFKFGVIFQKYTLKLIKIWKNYCENSRKIKSFSKKIFNFRVGLWAK